MPFWNIRYAVDFGQRLSGRGAEEAEELEERPVHYVSTDHRQLSVPKQTTADFVPVGSMWTVTVTVLS